MAIRLYNAVGRFVKALSVYEATYDNENQAAFINAYNTAAVAMSNAPVEASGEISEFWAKVEIVMSDITFEGNETAKFVVIKRAVARILKTLRKMAS